MKVSVKTGGMGASGGVAGAKPAGAGKAPAVSGVPAAEGDALSVSSGAQVMAVIKAKVDGIPDVRTEKVEAIRAQMDADAYHPDPEAVADGLLREHMPPVLAKE
jgi:negative regulator of flagellin synthesis FlgM